MSLTGVDDNEPASGLAGEIWAPNMVALVSLRGELGAAYRLVIDAQTTADGYFEVGNIVLGPVAVFGHRYSWGRTVDVSHGVDVATTRDRVTRSAKLHPPVRRAAVAWVDGVDLSSVSGAQPDPDYVKAETWGDPVASRHETPLLLEGLMSYLDGPHRPVVYLPSIQSNVQTQVLVRRHQMLFGRTLDGYSLENVQGDDLTNEVVRVATIGIEELV